MTKKKKHHRKRPEVRATTQLPSSRYFEGDIRDKKALREYMKGDDATAHLKVPPLGETLKELNEKHKQLLIDRGLIK